MGRVYAVIGKLLAKLRGIRQFTNYPVKFVEPIMMVVKHLMAAHRIIIKFIILRYGTIATAAHIVHTRKMKQIVINQILKDVAAHIVHCKPSRGVKNDFTATKS